MPEDQVLEDLDTIYGILSITRSELVEAVWEIPAALTPNHMEEMVDNLQDIQTIDRAYQIIRSTIDPRGPDCPPGHDPSAWKKGYGIPDAAHPST